MIHSIFTLHLILSWYLLCNAYILYKPPHYNDDARDNLYIQVVTLYDISKAEKNHIVPPPPQTDFFWSFHHGLAIILFLLNVECSVSTLILLTLIYYHWFLVLLSLYIRIFGLYVVWGPKNVEARMLQRAIYG